MNSSFQKYSKEIEFSIQDDNITRHHERFNNPIQEIVPSVDKNVQRKCQLNLKPFEYSKLKEEDTEFIKDVALIGRFKFYGCFDCLVESKGNDGNRILNMHPEYAGHG